MSCKSTDEEVDKVLSEYDRSRENLIPILQDIQDSLGYQPAGAMARVATYLGMSESQVYGVATFYAQFRFNPPGEHEVKVCQGTACHVRGSRRIMEKVCSELKIEPGETTEDQQFSLVRVACFGSCALAPVVVIDEKVYGRMTPAKVGNRIEDNRK